MEGIYIKKRIYFYTDIETRDARDFIRPLYNIGNSSFFLWIVGRIQLSIILLTHLCHFLWPVQPCCFSMIWQIAYGLTTLYLLEGIWIYYNS
jgi:hypothetical protein